MTTRGELMARRFHEAYERLAPGYGYKTREASAVPWADVPAQNKELMIATADAVLDLTSCERPEYYIERAGDVGVAAQLAAEDHLGACDAWLEYEDHEWGSDEAVDKPAGEESPSVGPYDGCQTCMVRETLHAAWPIIEEAVRSGVLDPR